MTFKLACGDVMPGCAARFETNDRETLLRRSPRTPPPRTASPRSRPDVLRAVESKVVVAA